MYLKAKPYLINPVLKRVYVLRNHEIDALLLSGETALAEKSMLNSPRILSRAIDKKKFSELNTLQIINPAWHMDQDYVELEIWKYNPLPLARNNIVDVISLSLSFINDKDERLEKAIEQIMEAFYDRRF